MKLILRLLLIAMFFISTVPVMHAQSSEYPAPPRSADGGDLGGYIRHKQALNRIAAVVPATPARTAVKAPVAPVRPILHAAPAQGGRCGGDLPPCWVLKRESTSPSYPNGGDPNAYNPTGCSGRGCRGKWQCDPATCDGTGTEAEQDAEARRVWANGRGCSHWAAC